ncbi:acetate/propionate family kinase [Maribacter polysaccharolyticus]|uniref:acetate/propionate family kinase n=1 Tax=Maribacter polysaccharolyticus TaxID=3020831 RepID=UPI00237FCEEF|nr:acetate kinase [Maribacter polysaccharolyticus]MDE3741980.1 acetate kinase [Maribacter polysaccharolyticus]
MKVLILNSGSSSIKFQLIAMPEEKVICSGLVERIGLNDAVITYKTDVDEYSETLAIENHQIGLKMVASYIMDPEKGVVKEASEIEAVGHRVVHGGDAFSDTTLVTGEVKEKIKEFMNLAPLHNPHNLKGIDIAEQIFPEAKQIAVFDTAFLQTIPVKARKYAIPNKFYSEHGIKMYGFHGTSHKYVSEKTTEYLNTSSSKVISIHLGNGCSMTALKDGKSIDHTLGFAPSNGLIMGSRSGDIDHSLIFYLVNDLGYDLETVNKLLINESGMLGLTGYSDLRDIEAEAEKGNSDCKLALDMNTYRIKKYIGAYTAALNGLDAIVFTAGIGENSSYIRGQVCKDMDFFGIELNEAENEIRSKEIREINTPESRVKILVIPTNEELEIAKQSYELLHA